MTILSATDSPKNRTSLTYIVIFFALLLGYPLLRNSPWQGSTQLHSLMEVAATLLAMIIGVMALVRFYSQKNNTILFIGAGFLGAGFLDGYHAVVTSSFFADQFPSTPSSLIPWSWVASRLFLSLFLWLSWSAWQREERLGQPGCHRLQPQVYGRLADSLKDPIHPAPKVDHNTFILYGS